ncbi:MAG: class I mannose-6-phosphate isomerase [Rhodoglobus sp.]
MPDFIRLPSNRPADRFYLGGHRITAFRGEPNGSDRQPEDWVASTTTLAGETSLGLTTLPDGRTLVDAIRADPVAWLGPTHVERFGADTKLLVKLLDAGQRLPVHAHPHSTFAHEHLGRAHGKAEAWFILSAGEVHIGLQHDVDPAELARLVAEQDTERMLALLHHLTVQPGDVVFVPAGVLHSVGAGVLLLELQEPEDLSILLEWAGFELDGAEHGHLGLGFGTALQAVEHRARTGEEIAALARPAGFGASVFPSEADAYFRLERHAVDGEVTLDPGFTVIVVSDGEVRLEADTLATGSTVLAPNSAGPIVLRGRGEVLVCRPPATIR